MSVISMKDLLEAGVHFGHQTKRWNPRMKKFLFTKRKGIHIIDLQKTAEYSEKAYNYVKEQASQGKTILFVGTKKQAQEEVKKAAEKCGMPYIVYRWLGGMLTNFVTVRASITRLKNIEAILEKAEETNLTKRELLQLSRERDKLNQVFSGIKEMTKLPDILFIVDTEKEMTAVHEAKNLNIPIVGVVDTNGNPDYVDHPIPGNDDAIRAITLFANMVATAVIKGRKKLQMENEGEEDQNNSEASDVDAEKIKEKYSGYEIEDDAKKIKSFETYEAEGKENKEKAESENTDEAASDSKDSDEKKEEVKEDKE